MKELCVSFRFTTFCHFIGFVCFPCQSCLRFRRCCSNCCLRIFVTLKVVHCRCIAYLDLYFRCHDHHLMVASLLYSVRLNMVMLISFVYHLSSLLYFWFVCLFVDPHELGEWCRQCINLLVSWCHSFVMFNFVFLLKNIILFYLFYYNLCNKIFQSNREKKSGKYGKLSLTFEWNWRTWIMLVWVVGMLEHWL